MTKECKSCKLTLPEKNFGKYQIKGRKYKCSRNSCNKCRRKQEHERYIKNPDIPIKMKARAKAHTMLKMYGITDVEYTKLLKKQYNKCAICFKIPNKTLNVDHCHKTGIVRGLLCWNCNIGIGYLKEDKNILVNAIRYLGEN